MIVQQAFPLAHASMQTVQHGMTLRDYFAAKAMHQLLAGAVLPAGFDAAEGFLAVSVRAYEMADAMLVAREA